MQNIVVVTYSTKNMRRVSVNLFFTLLVSLNGFHMGCIWYVVSTLGAWSSTGRQRPHQLHVLEIKVLTRELIASGCIDCVASNHSGPPYRKPSVRVPNVQLLHILTSLYSFSEGYCKKKETEDKPKVKEVPTATIKILPYMGILNILSKAHFLRKYTLLCLLQNLVSQHCGKPLRMRTCVIRLWT